MIPDIISTIIQGVIYVWNDVINDEPQWSLHSLLDVTGLSDSTLVTSRKITLNGHSQEILENTVDVNHFKTIHSAPQFLGCSIQKTKFREFMVKLLRLHIEIVENHEIDRNMTIFTFKYNFRFIIFSYFTLINFPVKFYIYGNHFAIFVHEISSTKSIIRANFYPKGIVNKLHLDFFSNKKFNYASFFITKFFMFFIHNFVKIDVSIRNEC